jgi:transcriptional regulator with XRE-family HTH domain
MTMLDAPTSPMHREAGCDIEIVLGLLPSVVVGTNAGIVWRSNLHHHVDAVTTVPACERRESVVADEVRRLRDDICRHGLTRQDVARGIGVDRRSLSGYASGEINPHPERVEKLRILARITREIDAQHPGRARDLMLRTRGDTTLLDAIAAGRDAIAAAWPTWVAGLRAQVDVRPRTAQRAEPIWSAAARALAEGRLRTPARATTVRPDATYEVDAAEAAMFDEPDLARRRPGYR